MVTIYTDGGCAPNPGRGAWACVVLHDGKVFTYSGAIEWATSNVCEMIAVIEAVAFAKRKGFLEEGDDLTIVSDSRYVVLGASLWIQKWKKSGWITSFRSKNESVKNIDQWQALDKISQTYKTTWKWIKGHAGIEYNEMCDEMVKTVIRKQR